MSEDCWGSFLAICCICSETALSTWCNTVSCGLCGTEGSGDGLCGSCLKRGFDEDAMDKAEAERKQQEEAQQGDEGRTMSAPNNGVDAQNDTYTGGVRDIQPSANPPMASSKVQAVQVS